MYNNNSNMPYTLQPLRITNGAGSRNSHPKVTAIMSRLIRQVYSFLLKGEIKMTKQEYENKIKELEKQIEELKGVKVEDSQPKRWKPNLREKYFYVSSAGTIGDVIWGNDIFDNWCYLTGNCFKTREEADEYEKQIEYIAHYKNYIEEHNQPIDWSDDNQEKWYAHYCFDIKSYHINYNVTSKQQGTIYASSKEIIRNAINEIGEDNFIKYVLGVVE